MCEETESGFQRSEQFGANGTPLLLPGLIQILSILPILRPVHLAYKSFSESHLK